jgi:aspartate/methionine/tyrosine aminotransferase
MVMVRLASRMPDMKKGFYGFFEPPPPGVVRFTVGEPDFDTPRPIVDAAIKALDSGDTHYVGSDGRPNLREAVANKLRSENGIPADPKNVVITLGGKEPLQDAMLAVLDPGDELILHSPSWPTYDPQVVIAHGKPVHVKVRSDNYHPDIEATKAAITPRTKMMIVNSPNNPTGAVYTKEELRAMADLAIDHDFIIMSDEIYEKMVYGGREHISIGSFPDMHDRVITTNGYSKAFAMTGWRLGYVHADAGIMDKVRLTHLHNLTCAVSFQMESGVVALTQCKDYIDEMVTEYDRRRHLLEDGLNSIEGFVCPEPEGAFYAFVNIKGTGFDPMTLYKRLLDEARVMLIPGTLFEFGEEYVRFSYATAYDQIGLGMERIREWLSANRP